MALLDFKTGDTCESYLYTAFGEETIPADSQNPWCFSSKRTDPETGFVYFGRRYYSPEMGRFVTCDPLGYEAGPNLYAYVLNNPLTHFDVYGLLEEKSSGGGFFSNLASGIPNCCTAIAGFFNHPSISGNLQAMGGLVESTIGASLSISSFGLLSTLGFALMAHGLG